MSSMLQIQYIDKRRPLLEVFDKSYYITVSYEECKRRRRQYTVPDPPGLFDGHVWPMYLKHRREMENSGLNIECLDGLKSRDVIYNF
ncbi:nicotinamide riboside kinase 2-like [Sander vitreus]